MQARCCRAAMRACCAGSSVIACTRVAARELTPVPQTAPAPDNTGALRFPHYPACRPMTLASERRV